MDAQQRVIDAVMGFYINLAALEEKAFMRWSQVEKSFPLSAKRVSSLSAVCCRRASVPKGHGIQQHILFRTIFRGKLSGLILRLVQ
jgi:hypothetical protein